ncbi:MAG: DUF523 and DUF1722 domain-containing protein, partial [Chloroflexota bacterium]|nr:DUF523 and DUF1722 domain-containing protein [Chloroflexota bacterium]
MGTPRETLRLVREGDGPVRMLSTRTNADWTQQMTRWSYMRVEQLAAEALSGYILKKDSPSCGMDGVKVYGGARIPQRTGRGLFAAALLTRLPKLPVEEEGRLSDPRWREHFIERVFAYWRLRQFFAARWTTGGLVAFHTAHKMALLSHSTTASAALGRLVASAAGIPRAQLRDDYEAGFMKTMTNLATPRRHASVLMHMAGHLKDQLDAASKQELLQAIDEYRRGLVPLVVPLTLVRHHVRVRQVAYLAGQTYLEPHPRELMLRNHV